MKKTKKMILKILMVILLLFIMALPTVVRALETIKPTTPSDEGLTKAANTIIGIVQFIGIIVAIVMLIIYGVRYFTSSPEKQGELRKAVWGYLIGAICIFGAVGILQVLKTSFDKAGIVETTTS